MKLTLFAVSIRGRKAYKDEVGNLYLECTKCHAIKDSDSFLNEQYGFLNRRYECKTCKNKVNSEYRKKKAYADYS